MSSWIHYFKWIYLPTLVCESRVVVLLDDLLRLYLYARHSQFLCMFRPKWWYQPDHMACGKTLGFQETSGFVCKTLLRYPEILGVDFPLFKLLHE